MCYKKNDVVDVTQRKKGGTVAMYVYEKGPLTSSFLEGKGIPPIAHSDVTVSDAEFSDVPFHLLLKKNDVVQGREGWGPKDAWPFSLKNFATKKRDSPLFFFFMALLIG